MKKLSQNIKENSAKLNYLLKTASRDVNPFKVDYKYPSEQLLWIDRRPYP